MAKQFSAEEYESERFHWAIAPLLNEALRLAAAISREPDEAMVEAAKRAASIAFAFADTSYDKCIRAAISAYRQALFDSPTTGEA